MVLSQIIFGICGFLQKLYLTLRPERVISGVKDRGVNSSVSRQERSRGREDWPFAPF